MSALGRGSYRQVFRLISCTSRQGLHNFSTSSRQSLHNLSTSSRQSLQNLTSHLDSSVLRLSPRTIQWEPVTRSLFTNKTEEAKEATSEKVEDVSENEKLLEEEVAKLKENNAELMDKYKRSLADFENLRNRMNKQVADSKKFGIQGFCKDLLDVADVLNKAVAAVPEDVLQNESKYLKDVYEGLRLTESQLLKVFERHGLVQENPLNEKFDPNKHDAIFQIPNPHVDANTVLDVQKTGYILHGRTIRPAMVGVSKK